MAEETENKYELGQLVTERFDEAVCRDEFEGDNICVLHGLEKAMVGTTEVTRTIDKKYTLDDLLAWLDKNKFAADCKVFSLTKNGTETLTEEIIKDWVRSSDYTNYVFNRDFTEEITCVVAVYERNLCIKCFADEYSDEDTAELHKDEHSPEELKNPDLLRELKWHDAEEYFEYNTIRSLPYAHAAAPIIIEGFDVDFNRWQKFKDDADIG